MLLHAFLPPTFTVTAEEMWVADTRDPGAPLKLWQISVNWTTQIHFRYY